MILKFSRSKFSFPLFDKIIKYFPKNLDKQTHNAFTLRRRYRYKDFHEEASTHYPEWQIPFQTSLTGCCAESKSVINSNFLRRKSSMIGRYVTSRNFHSSIYPLFNEKEPSKDKKGTRISYSILPKEKSEILTNFLLRNYHQQEPITMALGMPMSELDGWFQRYIRRCLFCSVCDVSVQAMDETTHRRVGMLASIIVDPNFSRPYETDFTNANTHPVNAEMNEFYEALEKGLDPVAEAGLKVEGKAPPKILEHLYISVHPEFLNQGISNRMIKLSESIATNINNCRVGYAVATSEFSYSVFLKNGYKVVKEIKYADYINSKGEHIFAGKEEKLKPHFACRALVKEIQCLYS